jgi:hypothetical protein
MFTQDPKLLKVRGPALECLGHVGIAVGKESFAPHFALGMQASMHNLQMQDAELREYTLVFFANSARAMKDGFAPHIEGVLASVFAMLDESPPTSSDENDNGTEDDGEDDDEDEDEVTDNNADEGSSDVSEAEDDSNASANDKAVQVYINNKVAALYACKEMGEHVGAGLAPYADTVLDYLVRATVGFEHDSADIRSECYNTLPSLLMCTRAQFGMTDDCKPGEMLSQLPPPVEEKCFLIMQLCLYGIEEDDEQKPVSAALNCMHYVLEQMGAAALTTKGNPQLLPGTTRLVLRELILSAVGPKLMEQDIGSRLLRNIKELLREKTKCQTNKVEIDEDADDEDHSDVMDSVTDLIGSLAKALGTSFLPQFDQLLPLLLKFARPSRVHSDRSMAIGCFADVLQHTGPDCIKYTNSVLNLVPDGLADSEQTVRRNSAFCLGALVGSTGTALVPQFMQFLQMLQPLCTRANGNSGSDTGGADTDNALSVVAHMIRASPTTIPLKIVLPVMLKALPLLQDVTEGPNIYRCLVELLSSMNPVAVELAPAIMNAFAVELKSELVTSTPEVKQYIVGALKGLVASSSHSELMSNAVGGMDQSMKAALLEAVSR